jgi:prepilin-type processing-associated H-X9-DG protein
MPITLNLGASGLERGYAGRADARIVPRYTRGAEVVRGTKAEFSRFTLIELLVVVAYLHNEGANLLFCDGHAHWQKKTQIAFLEFGANMTEQPNPNLTFTDPNNGCTSAACDHANNTYPTTLD